jgi:nucleoid DNA-binding protein
MAEKVATKAKPMTKSAVYQQLATHTKLTRKQVTEVFDALAALIKNQLGKKGPGMFTLPGLLKLKLVRKAATKARKVPSPFNPGQEMTIKAKPARNVVKAQALKSLKEMVK